MSLGAIYALIAIGYTMVYGIIGMINFAHGEIYMIGAYVGLVTLTAIGTNSGLPAASHHRRHAGGRHLRDRRLRL